MNKLLFSIILVVASVTQAKADLSDEIQFKKLTAAQAFASSKYEKTIWNIQMPGTSTWLNPAYEMCTTGAVVKSTRVITQCLEWTASNEGYAKKFKSKTAAEKYGGNATCSATASKSFSIPVTYTEEQCVLWGVKAENSGVKNFKYLSAAKTFADSDDAVSNATPFCIDFATVAKKMPTTYKVEFHLNGDKVGSHTYGLKSCGSASQN